MTKSSTESACRDLGILCDFREEKWASMDLAAEMLDQGIGNLPNCGWRSERIVPKYRPRFAWAKSLVGEKRARNIDRLYNRMRVYPRQLTKLRPYSFYHVCDHSYAQLLHGLPAGKAGVFCHDLDTFRCLIQPDRDPRPWWFRRMTQSILDGMRKAAVVFHPTMQTRREILEHGLVPAEKLVFAPNGVASEFTAEGREEDGELLQAESPFLLNVGSCIPRKRIDLLLRIFAHVQPTWPGLRLLQIGGQWTPEHEALLDELQIRPHVTQLRGMTREELAEYYRQATIVVQPTEAEGFGLPIVEAIACGALVVASDIPVLREVGGDAVTYAPVADMEAWGEALRSVKNGRHANSGERKQQAAKFTWRAHAEIIVEAYDRLAIRD